MLTSTNDSVPFQNSRADQDRQPPSIIMTVTQNGIARQNARQAQLHKDLIHPSLEMNDRAFLQPDLPVPPDQCLLKALILHLPRLAARQRPLPLDLPQLLEPDRALSLFPHKSSAPPIEAAGLPLDVLGSVRLIGHGEGRGGVVLHLTPNEAMEAGASVRHGRNVGDHTWGREFGGPAEGGAGDLVAMLLECLQHVERLPFRAVLDFVAETSDRS